MPDGTVFIVFCFLIRIVSALGSAATSTSCLTLLAQEFEDNLSPAVVRSFEVLNLLDFLTTQSF